MTEDPPTVSDETTTAENPPATEGSALAEAVQAAQDAKEEKVDFSLIGEETAPESALRLTVEVSRTEWDSRTETFFKDIRPQMAMDGFRRGKVPVQILRQRYAQAAVAEIAERVTPMIVRDFARSKDQTVYGTPSITDISNNPGQSVRLTIEIEVKPDIRPDNYTRQAVDAPKAPVKNAHVDARLESLRSRNATFVEEAKAFEAGDAAVLDHQVNGPDGLTKTNVSEHLYENPASELPVAVAAELHGKVAGDNGEVVDADGNTHRFVVRSVRARKLPALDDDFAKDLGKDNLEALRESIRAEVEKDLQDRAMDAAFDKLVERLVSAHTFEVPPTLMQNVSKELANQDYMMLRYTGRVPERLAEGYDDEGNRSKKAYEAALRRDSEQRVRGYLLLDAIGRKENLQPSEEDINKALELEAARQGRKPIAVRAALERQRRWSDFLENVRFDKVREFLLASTTITWTEPDESEAHAAAIPAAE